MPKKQAMRSRCRGQDISIYQTVFISPFPKSSADRNDDTESDTNSVSFLRAYIALKNVRKLRPWRCYDACLATFATPVRSLCILGNIAEPWRLFWTCLKQTPWLRDHRRQWRPQYNVWRFYLAFTTLMATLARSVIAVEAHLDSGLTAL